MSQSHPFRLTFTLPVPSKLSFPPLFANCFAGLFSPRNSSDTYHIPLVQEVRRREPCFVCGLPVFLAQRLLVGGHLYHRTCFRCARCSAQLTLANSYETQEGAYCCETCPDEEMVPQDIGDKGGGPPSSLLYIEHEVNPRLAESTVADDKTDSLVTSRTASLVGLRRMMFENIAHTDDEKSPVGRKLSNPMEWKIPSDFINEQPNRVNLSDKGPAGFGRNSSHRLSNSNIDKSDSSVIKSNSSSISDNSSAPIINDSSVSSSELNAINSDRSVEERTSPSEMSRPKTEVPTQQSVYESKSVSSEVTGDRDKFCSLNLTDSNIVEAENLNIDFQSKLDPDSELELHSCSSDNPLVQAKNIVIITSDDEIEYNKLIESKESIDKDLLNENKVIEDSEKGISQNKTETTEPIEEPKEILKEDNNVKTSKIEGIINDSENEHTMISTDTVSKTENKESVDNHNGIVKDEDEFTSLTNNIEQLVLDARNDDVVKAFNDNIKSTEEVDKESDITVSETEVPVPIARTVKHKPPTPQRRKVLKVPEAPKIEKPAEDYPEDLNPFGDDDEEEQEVVIEKPSYSTNPFGSSDEEEEKPKSKVEEIGETPKPAQRSVALPTSKVSLNPFSDDEDEEEESSTPVPKPRKLRTPVLTPEPSPQPRRLRPAVGNFGSSTSISSRKKKPAPLPPNLQNLTPGSRKSYSAPHPPSLSRTVTPSPPPLPTSSPPSTPTLGKDDKEYYNHRRQNSIVSESSSVGTIGSYTPHKSTYGQWKRKKGPAPPLPVPVRRTVQPVSLASIRQELMDIEVKQQGLERQGVRLEQTIRDNFQQAEGGSLTPHVEEMVLQLFELVNEKNELFRRQAELMYMRRQHNLEEEHAELEYQIRCLMLCPERNKTDSDKAREEQLIQRLVEVVERRNEIIDCLEMDRLREKEEDQSVGTQLGIFSAAVGSEVDLRIKSDKKSKKAKKEKRWSKKDMDKEVEEVGEKKKSKKKWFTLHHSASKS